MEASEEEDTLGQHGCKAEHREGSYQNQVYPFVNNAGTASLLGVHGHSGAERGLGRKDLASAYVLRPLNWRVLVFQSWVELSQYRVQVELIT
jgi:hypothetical protein